MAAQSHVIELALDLTRMPALARTSSLPPIPPNVVEIMRIAAASPKSCRTAAEVTGESESVVIDAARFYLQQLLFRPGVDSYRVLGIQQGTPRGTARNHMRLLLQWLHPDRNGSLESVYAERVLKAWRDVSAAKGAAGERNPSQLEANGTPVSVRLPWIKLPAKRRRAFLAWLLPAALMIMVVALWSATSYFGPDQGSLERTKTPAEKVVLCCSSDTIDILRGLIGRETPDPAGP